MKGPYKVVSVARAYATEYHVSNGDKVHPAFTYNLQHAQMDCDELNAAWEAGYRTGEADGNRTVVRSAIGHSVDGDDMQWTVNCPECNREYKCEGYFESTDIDTCKCGCVYRTERVYFEDGSFIS